MKTLIAVIVAMLFCDSAFADAIVEDNFNSYANGSIVGQGGWRNRSTGDNFVVQDTAVLEGTKVLYINAIGDSVIVKKGVNLTDGIQTFYVNTENRESWAEYSRIDFRVLASGWDSGVFCQVSLQWNGRVEYTKGGLNHLFATFDDNEWTKIDIEWRSVDTSARYRANDELWTDWYLFGGGGGSSFTGFDNVGIDFSLLGGSSSGGAHFDALGSNPVPEPSTIILLISGLSALLFRSKK